MKVVFLFGLILISTASPQAHAQESQSSADVAKTIDLKPVPKIEKIADPYFGFGPPEKNTTKYGLDTGYEAKLHFPSGIETALNIGATVLSTGTTLPEQNSATRIPLVNSSAVTTPLH